MLMYTALYRQWRPDNFDDVVGQDAIVQTLKNQIKTGRIGHAYLFSGSRGTGKTTTAKIFARAVNCIDPVDASPCNQCQVCTEMSTESFMDIFEIDAASNNGVDEIRDLRDKVRYPPTVGRYKVYIIDEVHMLSTSAFNALLKTLEEPPNHVIFILATTEPHKLPATILSRCQRYNFRRITSKVIVDRMKIICSEINVTVDDEGLFTIARWAEGGMRDALSLLDQCISFCGSSFTNDDILGVLGTADQGFIFETVDHIINGHIESLLYKIDQVIDEGKDISVFLKDLINHIRSLLVVKMCENPETILDVADTTLKRLHDQCQSAGQSRLVRALEIFSSLEAEIKSTTQPRLLFELAAIKLCRPSREDSLEALMDRIEMLEKKLASGVVVQAPKGEAADSRAADDPFESYIPDQEPPDAYRPEDDMIYPDEWFDQIYNEEPDMGPESRGDKSSYVARTARTTGNQDTIGASGAPRASSTFGAEGTSIPTGKETDRLLEQETKGPPKEKVVEHSQKPAQSSGDVIGAWKDILKAVKKERLPVYIMLKDGTPTKSDMGTGAVVIKFPPEKSFSADAIEKEENRTYLEGVIEKMTGQTIRIRCSARDDEPEEVAVVENKSDDIVGKAVELFGEDIVKVIDEE